MPYGEQEKTCDNRIGKFVNLDHSLSSIGKSHDAKL